MSGDTHSLRSSVPSANPPQNIKIPQELLDNIVGYVASPIYLSDDAEGVQADRRSAMATLGACGLSGSALRRSSRRHMFYRVKLTKSYENVSQDFKFTRDVQGLIDLQAASKPGILEYTRHFSLVQLSWLEDEEFEIILSLLDVLIRVSLSTQRPTLSANQYHLDSISLIFRPHRLDPTRPACIALRKPIKTILNTPHLVRRLWLAGPRELPLGFFNQTRVPELFLKHITLKNNITKQKELKQEAPKFDILSLEYLFDLPFSLKNRVRDLHISHIGEEDISLYLQSASTTLESLTLNFNSPFSPRTPLPSTTPLLFNNLREVNLKGMSVLNISFDEGGSPQPVILNPRHFAHLFTKFSADLAPQLTHINIELDIALSLKIQELQSLEDLDVEALRLDSDESWEKIDEYLTSTTLWTRPPTLTLKFITLIQHSIEMEDNRGGFTSIAYHVQTPSEEEKERWAQEEWPSKQIDRILPRSTQADIVDWNCKYRWTHNANSWDM